MADEADRVIRLRRELGFDARCELGAQLLQVATPVVIEEAHREACNLQRELRASLRQKSRLAEVGAALASFPIDEAPACLERPASWDDYIDARIQLWVDAEIDGERLSDEDLLNFSFLLLVAGNETTRNTLSHGILALAQ